MISTLIGAQYGSEGKGVIAHHLRNRYGVHVRVGGPNAGHSFIHNGQVWKMRAVPCGWTNPKAALVIGRGAVIDADLLLKEMEQTGCADRMYIDSRAVCITADMRRTEHLDGLQERIGSTLEGVGEARMARMLRGQRGDITFAGDYKPLGTWCTNTVDLLNEWSNVGDSILLEGTQGFGLSLYHGDWPFVTSADTTPAQLLADTGLSPLLLSEVIMVARTFPIRVGGNSGPMNRETSWEQMSQRMGRETVEYTTVTGRRRRIGLWDPFLFGEAVRVCRPTEIAITFMDYLFPGAEGVKTWDALPTEAQMWVELFEKKHDVRVSMLGTGGPNLEIIDR